MALSEKAVEPVEGGALLEEVGYEEWALRFPSPFLLSFIVLFLAFAI